MGRLATLLAVLACLLLPVAAVSTWVQLQVVDSARYVDAVAPLSSSAPVREATTTAIETAVSNATGRTLPAGSPAAGVLDDAVGRVLDSAAFSAAWTSGNRSAHRQVLAVLADDPDAVRPDGTIVVDLGALVSPVVRDIGAGGLVGDALSQVDVSVDLVDAHDLSRAQRVYGVVHAVGLWPLALWAALVAGALLLPGARRRVLGVLGVGSLLAAAAVAGSLLVGRTALVDGVPDGDAGLVGAFWDALAHSLWVALGGIAVVSVVALLLAAVLPRRRRTV